MWNVEELNILCIGRAIKITNHLVITIVIYYQTTWKVVSTH